MAGQMMQVCMRRWVEEECFSTHLVSASWSARIGAKTWRVKHWDTMLTCWSRQSQDQSEENSGSNTSSEEDDDDDDEEAGGDKTQGYNPADYANLQVSGEIKELFQYITVSLSETFPEFIPLPPLSRISGIWNSEHHFRR